MLEGNATAARGTAVLVLSQSCMLVLGYLTVVIMAREFGPVTYGAYGVIMSVLVWLEESGRNAIPTATTKLVAEATDGSAELEHSALVVNVAVYGIFFILLWMAAPWLASWFGIANGTLLFRVAAIDLPFFGAYTAYRAIYQGHRRFFQLGLSQVLYALTKLVGVLLLIRYDLSVRDVLLVNVAATLIGLACLRPAGSLRWPEHFFKQIAPLMSTSASIGLYYFVLLLRGSLILWILQILSPKSAGTMIGVFVAAFNIARVPTMLVATVTTVILPSLSRALAANDEQLARRYINQALRFCFIFYLPVCLVLMAQPEELIQWIYSKDFSGGGLVLSLLVAGEGIHLVHAILCSALTAAGQARRAAVLEILTLAPAVAMYMFLIHNWGAAGAALSSVLIGLLGNLILGILVWKRFATFMSKRSALNIGVSACLMFLVFQLLSKFDGIIIMPYAGGLAAYGIGLLVLQEITRQDFAGLVPPWNRLKRCEARSGDAAHD
jgi:O-antigen/teichoic acid export membrane protein